MRGVDRIEINGAAMNFSPGTYDHRGHVPVPPVPPPPRRPGAESRHAVHPTLKPDRVGNEPKSAAGLVIFLLGMAAVVGAVVVMIGMLFEFGRRIVN